MDIFQVLNSVNKLSIVAFFVMLGFLVYEVFQLKKEHTKEVNPDIPRFDNIQMGAALGTPAYIAPEVNHSPKKSIHLFIIGILVLMLIITGGFTLFNRQHKAPETASSSPQSVQAADIKLFQTDWIEIPATTQRTLSPQTKLIIGIETVKDADIDSARIRVNQTTWKPTDVTSQFNPTYGVYYVAYTPASGAAQLKIEGQLHSHSQGWLGE